MYGFTAEMVGTFDRIRNMGMISNSDAVIDGHRDPDGEGDRHPLPAAMPRGAAEARRRAASTGYPGARAGASCTGSAYRAGLRRHVISTLTPQSTTPAM